MNRWRAQNKHEDIAVTVTAEYLESLRGFVFDVATGKLNEVIL